MVTPQRIVLALALMSGLLFIAIVPPWQHYDEPTHFEYAWLIANRPGLPEEGDYDQAMRREAAASMAAHDFYQGMGGTPNLLQQDRRIGIGYSELRHPPLYYLLASVPLRWIRHADVTFQLYAARGVSLLLFLLTVWIAGRVLGELTSAGHALGWAVPGMMALLPGYVDLMTGVNNDVGATALFSLFLWGATRLIVRGVTPLRVVWMLAAAGLCVWTKNTAAVAVVLVPLALLLAALPESWRRRTWAGILLLGLVLAGLTFAWGDAAVWHRWYAGTHQATATRQEVEEAPLGEHALALQLSPDEYRAELRQSLLRDDAAALRGQTVTLGAWMWATRSMTVRSPMIVDDRHREWQRVEVGAEPTFHTVTATIATDASHVEVRLRPVLNAEGTDGATVYYDGIVLTAGEWPLDDAVGFKDPGGKMCTWGGWTFVNLLRNSSGEQAWPRVRQWVDGPVRRYASRPPAALMASVLDWPRTGWTHRRAGLSLLKTFWARFGWAHVDVAPGWYWAVGVITVLGLVGAAVATLRTWGARALHSQRAVVFLAAAALVVWGNALMRMHPLRVDPLIPAARYAFPAIIPTALALMGGWLALVQRRWKGWAAVVWLVAIGVLQVVSLTTIASFYGG